MEQLNKHPHFSFGEMVYSQTALMKGIDNCPKDENIIKNIEDTLIFLEGLRMQYGKPIIISSGYRCPDLNKTVGGVKNSGHLTGYAADLQPGNGDFNKFCEIVLEYIKDKDFDQCIIEKNSKGAKWVHLSIDPRNRKKSFKMNVK